MRWAPVQHRAAVRSVNQSEAELAVEHSGKAIGGSTVVRLERLRAAPTPGFAAASGLRVFPAEQGQLELRVLRQRIARGAHADERHAAPRGLPSVLPLQRHERAPTKSRRGRVLSQPRARPQETRRGHADLGHEHISSEQDLARLRAAGRQRHASHLDLRHRATYSMPNHDSQ